MKIIGTGNIEINVGKAKNEEELLAIKKLAILIWNEVYKDILPDEQINLLLTKYFEINSIRNYINDGYEYVLFKYMDNFIGFASYVEKVNYFYIDKIYFIENFRRKGIAKRFIKLLIELYKKPAKLNVNQKNIDAINAYKAIGFTIEKEEIIELGSGLQNIDFVMIFEKY
ncbi:MAG: GNAT family N-acetyltransferase [Bacilli bacterium]|nr:GNAT family N-acetyltransferase [Bacilli bacterium]